MEYHSIPLARAQDHCPLSHISLTPMQTAALVWGAACVKMIATEIRNGYIYY